MGSSPILSTKINKVMKKLSEVLLILRIKTEVFYQDTVSFFKYDLPAGIKNLIHYFPVIWKDRQWDHAFMENLMLVKLEKWYKYFSNDCAMPYEGIEKDLQAMRICINVLKRRQEDWYTKTWYNKYAHRKRMVTEPCPDQPGYSVLEWVGLTEDEQNKSTELMKQMKETENRDWKIFCTIFEKRFNSWWD